MCTAYHNMCSMCGYIHIYIYIYIYQEGMRNQTEPAESNRTEPFNSGTDRNQTRNPEPDRATACPKNASRTASNRKNTFPNRTEPNR